MPGDGQQPTVDEYLSMERRRIVGDPPLGGRSKEGPREPLPAVSPPSLDDEIEAARQRASSKMGVVSAESEMGAEWNSLRGRPDARVDDDVPTGIQALGVLLTDFHRRALTAVPQGEALTSYKRNLFGFKGREVVTGRGWRLVVAERQVEHRSGSGSVGFLTCDVLVSGELRTSARVTDSKPGATDVDHHAPDAGETWWLVAYGKARGRQPIDWSTNGPTNLDRLRRSAAETLLRLERAR